MKYPSPLRTESVAFPAYRQPQGALVRPVDRDLERLIALLEGQAERDRTESRRTSTRRYQETVPVPVLWERDPDEAPTTLFYPTQPPPEVRSIEDSSVTKQRRRHAVWQFCLAFGSAALMVSVLPAALWVAGLLPRNEPNAAAAPPPPGVIVSRSASSSTAAYSSANASKAAGSKRPGTNANQTAATLATAATHAPATTQPAPKPRATAAAPEANGAPADLAKTAHPAAVENTVPRSDVARSL